MLSVLISAALMTTTAPSAESSPCQLDAPDRAWLDRSMSAWNYAANHISGIGHVKKIQAVIFDKDCVVTSSTAMNGGPNRWESNRHQGKVKLPDGTEIPSQVISFSGSVGDHSFFVMSTPSVWRAAGKTGKGTTLENLMTAVMLHEGTHVAQMPTYGEKIGEISDRNKLPQDFNDDSIQKQFEKDKGFASSVEREAKLLFMASRAKTHGEAVRLVRSARAMMKARYARWFVGKDAYLAEAEPIWLTLEGSGQWLAYRWETDARGGRVASSAVMPGFEHDKWWSQREGLAAFLALERLTGATWKRQAFGTGRKDILQMLDEATATDRLK